MHRFLPLALLLASPVLAAPPTPILKPYADFMPVDAIGARTYVQQHPEQDGRGLVVAVLDTGVDPLASGLQKTSTGVVKVLEARDFTGQGDVALDLATVVDEGGHLRVQRGTTELRDLEKLPYLPQDGQWWLGAFREAQIGPANLRDLNRDGKSDGELALLVWRVGPGVDDVRALLDLDGNGSVLGDPIVRPYHVAQELFVPAARNPLRDQPLLSLACEIDWLAHTAQLHFTDGSHGTHVAGIISGFRVFDKEGWDGVAPGAQVLSLKIGHNAQSGGATTTESFSKALEFAARWSRIHQQPVVVNASYGIGSALEGHSDIDKLVDRIVRDNPLLTISFSAGNSGPGLSSIGTPGAADLALAVGAMVPKQVVPTLYGGKTSQDEVFAFSSRGGELNKPEVVAPGVAASAVPIWDGREVKNGTSMAAPEVAGAMLLVWASLLADRSDHKPGPLHSGLVRRALVWSARPLAGYGLLDQGHGLIDVPRATALARRLARRPEAKATLGYHLQSHAPRADKLKPPAMFWRTGSFLPDASWPVKTEVQAILPGTMTAQDREQFSVVLDLSVQADWLELVRPRLLLRGEKPAQFEVRLKPDKLRQPGVYTTKVVGREAGAAVDEAAFETWQTVVVPERFDLPGHRQMRWQDVRLQPGQVWRKFVLVPPGARHVLLRASRRPGQAADLALAVFDPDGERIRPRSRLVSARDGVDAEWLEVGDDLDPGVWEVTLAASLTGTLESHADVEIAFTGAEITGVTQLKAKSGGLPAGTATVTNLYEQPFVGTARAKLDRAVHQEDLEVKEDRARISVVLGPLYAGAQLLLELDRKTYAKCTDVAVIVRDAAGVEVVSTAFQGPKAEVEWKKPGAGEAAYTVEIVPGFAHERKGAWKLDVRQSLVLARPVPMTVTGPEGSTIAAFPLVPVPLDVQVKEPLPGAPDGFAWAGDVELWSADGRQRWLVVPVQSW
jgi:tripeptidyl-peptidase-2